MSFTSDRDLGAEIVELKRLLRKYAATAVGNPQHGNIQCNCCGNFGLYSHKEGCELAPYLTKLTANDAAGKG